MEAIRNLIKKIRDRFSKKEEFETVTNFSLHTKPGLAEDNTVTSFGIPKKIRYSANISFEKFYPMVMLILIALFTADLTILLFRDSLLPTQAPPVFPTNYKMPAFRTRTEYTPITDRNIFNSDGIIPNPLNMGEGEMFADNGPAIKSSLPLLLVGTIVHINPGKSVATIQLKTNNEVIPFIPNDPIENIATLIKVDRRRAIIRNSNNNRLEYIEIPEDAKISFNKPAAPQGATGAFKKEGDTIAIKRSDLNNYLKNLPDLLQQATAVPNIVPGSNGQVDGFKLLAMEPNSVFGQMGLKVGDVIKGVNGEPVNSPAKAMELYNKLRNDNNVQLEIDRDGHPTTFNFNIND
jgi:general secretion pathway protein C